MGIKEKRRRKRYTAMAVRCVCVTVLLIFIGGLILVLKGIFDDGKASNDKYTEQIEEQNNILEIANTEYNIQQATPKASENISETELEKVTETDTEITAISTIESEYQRILTLPAGEVAITGMVSSELTEKLFYSTNIDDTLLSRINGVSYMPNEYMDITELRYLKMLCYGIDGNTYVGEMIVNEKIADTVLEIFKTLYENQYPIERMVLVDNYQADDESSMSANNTSAFNFRQISGSSKLSNHSYGMAIDINPMYNPYVKTASDGSIICQPENGRDYIDRAQEFPYKIDENDLAYKLFTEAGFTWGGNWNSVKDYQHFEMCE